MDGNPATRRFTHLSFSTELEDEEETAEQRVEEEEETTTEPPLPLQPDSQIGNGKKRKLHGDDRITAFSYSSSSQNASTSTKTALIPLQIVNAQQSGQRVYEYVSKSNQTPWEAYRPLFDVRLGKDDYIAVAERRNTDSLPGSSSRKSAFETMAWIKTIRNSELQDSVPSFSHPNLFYPLELFIAQGRTRMIYDYMLCSLSQVADSPCLEEEHIVALVGQILDALKYLESRKLGYQKLDIANIFVSPAGQVKIGWQEAISQSSIACNPSALSCVIVDIMKGTVLASGTAIEPENASNRWSSEALNFPRFVSRCSTIVKMFSHPFMNRYSWRSSKVLVGLLSFVSISTVFDKRYPSEAAT